MQRAFVYTGPYKHIKAASKPMSEKAKQILHRRRPFTFILSKQDFYELCGELELGAWYHYFGETEIFFSITSSLNIRYLFLSYTDLLEYWEMKYDRYANSTR